MQNGVEIVANGTEPYALPGTPRLSVREEFRMDLEADSFAQLGLSEIALFDLDSKGRVYLFRRPFSAGPLVFVFDERGKFLKSFLRPGQGPGEIQMAAYEGVTSRDEIAVFDHAGRKLSFFDGDGLLLHETRVPADLYLAGLEPIVPLENGNFLIRRWEMEPSQLKRRGMTYGIYDSSFKKIKDLVGMAIPDTPEKFDNPIPAFPFATALSSTLYAGFINKDIDISVYDQAGRPSRVIRKASPSVAIPARFGTDLLSALPQNVPLSKDLKLPRCFPDCANFFPDDAGRLFVATYEKDAATGQTICYVFAADGTFIQRLPLGYSDLAVRMTEGQSRDPIVRNDRLACVRLKDSGFKEIVVYSLRWS